MDESTIEYKFPVLAVTEQYKRFTCPDCRTVNGTMVYADNGESVVVCGGCWGKFNLNDVE